MRTNCKSPRTSRAAAFTLIEMLIVVAIIGLLVAIMFPVFARARENARRTSCQNHLKQIGMGMLQYTQDFDESLISAIYGTGAYNQNALTDVTSLPTDPGYNYKWMDAVYPYVKSEQVFNCPIDGNKASVAGTWTSRNYKYPFSPLANSSSFGSYLINNAYGFKQSDSFASPSGLAGAKSTTGTPLNQSQPYASNPIKLAALAAPATTVWVVDGFTSNSGSQIVQTLFDCDDAGAAYALTPAPTGIVAGNPPYDYVGIASASAAQQFRWAPAKHLETSNVLFCDGHVKAMKLSSLMEQHSVTGTCGNTGAPGLGTYSIAYLWTIQDD